MDPGNMGMKKHSLVDAETCCFLSGTFQICKRFKAIQLIYKYGPNKKIVLRPVLIRAFRMVRIYQPENALFMLGDL